MYSVVIIILCFVPLSKNQWAIDDSGCITPNSAVGDCIPIKNCQSIINVITEMDPLSTWISKELSRYQCGFTKTSFKVCCPYDSKTLAYLLVEDLLPRAFNRHHYMLPDDCGLTSDSNKIIQGELTRVFQFPWMALLSYRKKNLIDFKCAGSIINKWYILTAAHCISDLGKIKLIGVRAGEHNLSSPIDCNQDYNNQSHCAESVQDVGIGKIIPHPQYNSATFENDIGLIRLATPLNTSVDNVKPICLPVTKEFVDLNLTETICTVTGWGWTEKGKKSDVLLKADVSIINNEECKNIYQKHYKKISDNQICAGGSRQDSCEGDSGGPLQTICYYNNDIRYMQHGIVSYGPILCGQKGIPGVYTRVDKYMEWILDNMDL